MTTQAHLPADYVVRELSDIDFRPLWDSHAEKIFDDHSQVFRLFRHLSESETTKALSLRKNLGEIFYLNLGLFYRGEFVGWAAGHQESAETFYMRNSAILPGHRRKGLYSYLLNETVRIAIEKGFQKIYSRHSATNNDVIIPKLKAGFTISSLEVSDLFGVLVHLVYFPKALRRKMMIYRVGDSKPDDEIKACLGID